MKKSTLTLGVAFIFIFALGIFLGQLFFGSGKVTSPTASPGSDSNLSKSSTQPSKSADAETTPPPWANSMNKGGDFNTANTDRNNQANDAVSRALGTSAKGRLDLNGGDVGAREKELAAMQTFQNELQQATASGKPDPKKMMEIFERLKQARGPVVAGVNLDVVIGNLSAAQQMQELSAEIQKENSKGQAQDPKRMKEYMDRLQKLQGQLRTDVSVSSASTSQVLTKK